MARRTKEQWHTLFEEQQQSGLNYTQFCKTKKISPKYFSLRKCQLKRSTVSTAKKSSFIAVKVQPSDQFIVVEHKQTRIKLPEAISINWLAQFVHQLG